MNRNIPRRDFAAYSRATPGARFSEWPRDEAEPCWTHMVGHRMTRDMAADSLPADVLLRYLVYEHGFVETAVTIFGYALVKAPGIAEQTRLAAALQGLTTDQLAWFRRVFGVLGVTDDQRVVTDPPQAVSAFRDGMLSVAAHGAYEEIIAGMAAAEWMYLTWSRTANARCPSDPVCAEWIALHVARPFADQVAWLLDELDRLGPELAPTRQLRLGTAFWRTLILEIGFHDAPYAEAEAKLGDGHPSS